MCARNFRRLVLTVTVLLVGQIARVVIGQSSGPVDGDARLRSELALGGRTAILAYPSDLKATDPRHKALLGPTTGSVRVRVGQLETTGSLRIGTVELKQETPAAS